MDYKNGKIYKITSDSTNKIYIGTTCQPLCKRIAKHKNSYKRFQNGKRTNVSSFELIKLGDAIITLIENYPCENKEQLRAKERYYIELNKDICVNRYIPNRTSQEYKITDNYKNYRKLKITCECGKEFLITNKPRHEKSEKHLAYMQSHS
jgi:hypothetical protein